jgi:hypothetical protein
MMAKQFYIYMCDVLKFCKEKKKKGLVSLLEATGRAAKSEVFEMCIMYVWTAGSQKKLRQK